MVTTVEATFRARILPVDESVADLWGRMQVPNPLSPVDGLIAATALVHGLTLVTCNVADVKRMGASCLNPFDPEPR